jgi:hypothetical protein
VEGVQSWDGWQGRLIAQAPKSHDHVANSRDWAVMVRMQHQCYDNDLVNAGFEWVNRSHVGCVKDG